MTSGIKEKILYWLLTASFCLAMLLSSIGYLMKAPEMLEGLGNLGYPVYLLTILGTAKLLGVFAIVLNRFTTLKEWAYAGFTFNLLGASASHAFAGDDLTSCIVPLVILCICLSSYFVWKKKFLFRPEEKGLKPFIERLRSMVIE